MCRSAAHHRRVALGDPEPPGPTLRSPHQMWWAPPKLHSLGKGVVWSIARTGTGGTPRGTSSTCEQRDGCPTLTDQQYFPPVAWHKQCKQFVSRFSNQCAYQMYLNGPPASLLGGSNCGCVRVRARARVCVRACARSCVCVWLHSTQQDPPVPRPPPLPPCSCLIPLGQIVVPCAVGGGQAAAGLSSDRRSPNEECRPPTPLRTLPLRPRPPPPPPPKNLQELTASSVWGVFVVSRTPLLDARSPNAAQQNGSKITGLNEIKAQSR